MKKIGIALAFLVSGLTLQAQTGVEYKERALEVQKEIWNDENPAFKVKEINPAFKDESGVIIAKSFEATSTLVNRFKMKSIFGGRVRRANYLTTIRQRVLIKDKSALDDFSTLNYDKVVDQTARMAFAKIVNTYRSYIGARILKPDGKEIVIQASEEEVLVKDEKKQQEGKIAFPDLQVNDILDYYIRIEEVIEDNMRARGPNVFFLAAEYPIMYYNIRYVLDKKTGVDVMSMNGAQEIKGKRNDDDELVIDLTEKDLPKIATTLWTSQARQLPYYVIRYGYQGADILAEPGKVKTGPFAEQYVTRLKNAFFAARTLDGNAERAVVNHLGKRNIKDLPVDSIVVAVYNYFRWREFGRFTTSSVSNKQNHSSMNYLLMALLVSETLKMEFKIPNDVGIVANRYSGRLTEAFGIGDFETFVKVNGGGNLTWLCFNDFFQTPGQLASVYQGEEAYILERAGRSRYGGYLGGNAPVKLPQSKSEDNKIVEDLTVNFTNDNLQLLQISRNCKRTGAMKPGMQKDLMLPEDVEAGFATMLSKKKELEALSEKRTKKEQASEVQAAMDRERANQKEYFIDEIREQYEQRPKEILSYNILNNGLSVAKPAFEFEESFTMENFVKKAGNNYIVEVGKLMGAYSKTEEKDRNRSIDVYMSAPRVLSYTFHINIPEGYTAKGFEGLANSVENDISKFKSTVDISGNTVHITAVRTYDHNFEPATNWAKLLTIMDAAHDFTTKKLLLEKNK